MYFREEEDTQEGRNEVQPTFGANSSEANKETMSDVSQTRFVSALFTDTDEDQVESPLSTHESIEIREERNVPKSPEFIPVVTLESSDEFMICDNEGGSFNIGTDREEHMGSSSKAFSTVNLGMKIVRRRHLQLMVRLVLKKKKKTSTTKKHNSLKCMIASIDKSSDGCVTFNWSRSSTP